MTPNVCLRIAFSAPADLHWLARALGQDTLGVTPGLGSTATTPLILELLHRGHELTLFTLCNQLKVETEYQWGTLKVYVGPSRHYGASRTFYAQEIRYLRGKMQEVCPTFVHAHWTYEFALGALLANRRTLVTIHDLPWNVLRYFRDRSRAVRLLMAYAVAIKANRYTAVSNDAARHFRRYMRPQANIASIPNFISLSVLDLAKTPGRHPKRPLIFAAILQGWSTRKNPTAALRAFRNFRASVQGSRLFMIGSGYGEGGPAHRWALEHSADRDVTFVGPLPYQTMLNTLASEVDVLIAPSMDEALSMTVLESMALGKPVIAGSFTPGMRQELGDGVAGLLVNVRSPDSICAAMLRLQRDPELFESLSRTAFHRAREVFTADQVVPRYEAIYADLAGGPSSIDGEEKHRIADACLGKA